MANDTLIKGMLFNESVRMIAISGKGIVEEAKRIHGLSRVCTAALGRTLMITSMMGSMLKNDTEKVSCIVSGGGPAGNIVCTSSSDGAVKGYIEEPTLELPPTTDGKLDVSTAVGWFGKLTVVRDMSLKEPYVGTCAMVSGEIAEDFANYFTVSEQQPTLLYLGVRIDAESGDVRSAGGILVQPLPNCPDEYIDVLTAKASEISRFALMLETSDARSALDEIFDGAELCVTNELSPCFKCDCSRERLEKVLIALGRDELMDMIKTDGHAELTCHFCNEKYDFSCDELERLLFACTKNRTEDDDEI